MLRSLAAVLVFTCASAAASVAPAAAAPAVRVQVTRPCVAGACVVELALRPTAATRLEANFAHRGAASDFVPAVATGCAPASVAYVDTVCRLRAALPPVAGPVTVAWRVVVDGAPAVFGSRTIQVRAPRRTTRRPASRPEDPFAALCAQARPSDTCHAGGGRRTPGGGEKVTHKGWPSITGVLWKVNGNRGGRFTGGPKNDELLGHHGSDRIAGGPGKDVIWGDWDPEDNNGRQRDRLDGGPGNDWIYSSHGRNTIRGGAGRDYVWAYYGRGTIDCGPGGQDTARVRLGAPYRVRNCERIKNFCGHGSKPGGGCYKPGERPRGARR